MNLLKRVRPWLLLLLIPVLFAGVYQPASAQQIAFPPPTITSLTYSSGLIELTWSMKAGHEEEAEYYWVYRSVNGGSFSEVAKLNGSGSTYYQSGDAQPGSTYTFKVMAGCYYGRSVHSAPRSVTIPLPVPNITSATYSSGVIQLKWNSVAGASYYEVYRSINGGSFSKLKKNSPGTTYEFDGGSPGNSYSFKVRAVSGYVTGPFSNPRDVTIPLAAPEITGLTLKDTSITVNWTAVQGATGYQLYCCINEKPSVHVGDSAGTTFTFKDAKPGSHYNFKVQAVSDSTKGPFSPFKNITVPLTAAPAITGLILKDTSITVNWTAVQGATGYQLYCCINEKPSVHVGDSAGTTFTFKDAKPGSHYNFKVRAVSKYSNGPFSPFKNITVPLTAAPAITGLILKDTSITVNWTAVQGATGYQLYCCINEKPSVHVGDSAGTTFTFKDAKPGSHYNFKVRAVSKYSNGPFSPFKNITVPLTAAPEITGLTLENSAITVNWTAVQGATGYQLYCCINEKPSIHVGDSAGTTFTFKDAKPGSHYNFKVRAVSKYSNGPFSPFKSIVVPLAAPEITEIAEGGLSATLTQNTPSFSFTPDGQMKIDTSWSVDLGGAPGSFNLFVKWTAVPGASGYEVFCAVNDAPSALAVTTEKTSCVYKGAQLGNKYSFQVRAVSKYAKGPFSNFRALAFPLPKPSIQRAIIDANRVMITWDPVSGATQYEVWQVINDQISSSLAARIEDGTVYTSDHIQPGNTYSFWVRALNEFAVSEYSDTVKLISLAPPSDLWLELTPEGKVQISWPPVPGATTYEILKKVNDASYYLLTTTSLNISNDLNSVLGQTYTYKVRAKAGSIFTPQYSFSEDSIEKSITLPMLQTPNIKRINQNANMLNVNWDKADYAIKYMLYYSINNGPFTTNATRENISPHIHGMSSRVETGKYYIVKVTAVAGDGSEASAESSKPFFMMPEPVITKLSVSGRQVTIEWDRVPQAVKYELRRDGKTVATLNGETFSYTDTVAGPGNYKYLLYAYHSEPNHGSTWVYSKFVTVP